MTFVAHLLGKKKTAIGKNGYKETDFVTLMKKKVTLQAVIRKLFETGNKIQL